MAHNPLHDPANWVLGGLGSVTAVGGAILFDPTGAVAAIVATTVAQAPTLFTLSSLGLAAGDRFQSFADYQTILLGVWVVSGLLFAAGLADEYWDGLKERLL